MIMHNHRYIESFVCNQTKMMLTSEMIHEHGMYEAGGTSVGSNIYLRGEMDTNEGSGQAVLAVASNQ